MGTPLLLVKEYFIDLWQKLDRDLGVDHQFSVYIKSRYIFQKVLVLRILTHTFCWPDHLSFLAKDRNQTALLLKSLSLSG